MDNHNLSFKYELFRNHVNLFNETVLTNVQLFGEEYQFYSFLCTLNITQVCMHCGKF